MELFLGPALPGPHSLGGTTSWMEAGLGGRTPLPRKGWRLPASPHCSFLSLTLLCQCPSATQARWSQPCLVGGTLTFESAAHMLQKDGF